jgi:hypothetical protein
LAKVGAPALAAQRQAGVSSPGAEVRFRARRLVAGVENPQGIQFNGRDLTS